MNKKSDQWPIDRGFNFNSDNEKRIKTILTILHNNKIGKISEEQAKQALLRNGVIESIARYEQSTATLFRKYGLIFDPYLTTEVSDLYVENKISFSQLILIQLVKKEFLHSQSSVSVFVLEILLNVLTKIQKINPKDCWIDTYDYLKYLTEIKNKNEIDSAVENIIKDKSLVTRETEYLKMDFDIWYSLFISSKLFVPYHTENQTDNLAITINTEYMDLINFLLENYHILSPIGFHKIPKGSSSSSSKLSALKSFGSIENGIFLMLPKIEIDNSFGEVDLKSDDKQILYNYLFNGSDYTDIEKNVFPTIPNNEICGFTVEWIIKYCYGLNETKNNTLDYKGIWKPFINNESLIKVNPFYKNISKIIDTLFPNENFSNELPIRKSITERKFDSNTILYGPPGTGKTYQSVLYAISIVENNSIEDTLAKYPTRSLQLEKYNEYIGMGYIVFTTFHQNTSYEDFIEGLRPVENSNGIKFAYKDGIFKTLANTSLFDNSNLNFVMIIDEINRGNISNIFGELITLIDEDKRWGEKEQIYLQLASGDKFTVPNNLYILGTMNSTDKSISLIDIALRRRFAFEPLLPNDELIEDQEVRAIFKKLNDILFDKFQSSDYLIGHSYFIGKTISDMPYIFNKKIIPLLSELFVMDLDSIKECLTDIFDNKAKLFTNQDLILITQIDND